MNSTPEAVATMLRARSVALVGASARAGSFGARMIDEVTRGPAHRTVHLVNPRYEQIDGRRCVPSLKHLDGPVELALLGVGDDAVEAQLRDAAEIGVRSAVIFGSAHGEGLRTSLRAIASEAGMAVCGAGCMGFVNLDEQLRATGYLEPPELTHGPIALVTHSGSIFSALLRTRRALGYTIAVSSGQELVTTTADYLGYALEHTATKVLALVLESVRDGSRLVAALRRAASAGIPTVVLPVGRSALGASLVAAHSGALAGGDATWEALAEGTGALLVRDLAEFTDTLELLAIGRRARAAQGLASVHDSGAERTMLADRADALGVPFAPLVPATLEQLGRRLDAGLVATNPLDLWGNGADTRQLFASCLQTIANDPTVSVVALAVDLVEEYDGDTSYIDAALDVGTDAPLVVLTNLGSAVDHDAATRLRGAGIPVLEGTSSGLVAIGHLLALAESRHDRTEVVRVDAARQHRWRMRFVDPTPLSGVESFALLADYGLPVVPVREAVTQADAVAAAQQLGYPVVLKTAASHIVHKSDVGAVVVGIADDAALRAAYNALSARIGPEVIVCATAPAGVELALGMVRDPHLGPVVVVAAGGVLAELVRDRSVALPPLTTERAGRALQRLTVRDLLAGWRGAAPADVAWVLDAIVAVGAIAHELGEQLVALDVNPILAGPQGALAVDVFVERTPSCSH